MFYFSQINLGLFAAVCSLAFISPLDCIAQPRTRAFFDYVSFVPPNGFDLHFQPFTADDGTQTSSLSSCARENLNYTTFEYCCLQLNGAGTGSDDALYDLHQFSKVAVPAEYVPQQPQIGKPHGRWTTTMNMYVNPGAPSIRTMLIIARRDDRVVQAMSLSIPRKSCAPQVDELLKSMQTHDKLRRTDQFNKPFPW